MLYAMTRLVDNCFEAGYAASVLFTMPPWASPHWHVAVSFGFSFQGTVHVTLAAAAVESVLEALREWQARGRQRGFAATQRQLAAAEGRLVPCIIENTLATSAYLQLDFGDHRFGWRVPYLFQSPL